jgi:bifunctional non-homologous end joining protein LigD
MALEGEYIGSVSLGLNDALRGAIAAAFRPDRTVPPPSGACPFAKLPDDLKREQLQWLPLPFKCRVTGLEITAAGQLRHPKLVTFLPKEPLP